MKPTLLLAALTALSLPAASLRADEAKTKDPAKESPAPETGTKAPPPKKEKPPRPEAGEGKTPPRPRLQGKPGPKAPGTAAKSEKRTWLGVSTHTVDPSLREHLELPPGFGIQIVEVMPDSPAADAGIRSNDVLVRLDDQRLISPEHLSILVREKSEGDKVRIALIRRGREETVEVVLGQADETVFGPWNAPGAGPGFHPVPPHFGQDPSKWQEQIRRQQDQILRQQKEWMEKHRQGMVPPGPGKPHGHPPGISVSPGFPLRVFGTEGVLKIDNDAGELTLTQKGEDQHLVIEDAAGKVVYDGPYDAKKGVQGLPENARKQLEAMKLGNLEIALPEKPAEDPEKTKVPKKGEGDSGEIL